MTASTPPEANSARSATPPATRSAPLLKRDALRRIAHAGLWDEIVQAGRGSGFAPSPGINRPYCAALVEGLGLGFTHDGTIILENEEETLLDRRIRDVLTMRHSSPAIAQTTYDTLFHMHHRWISRLAVDAIRMTGLDPARTVALSQAAAQPAITVDARRAVGLTPGFTDSEGRMTRGFVNVDGVHVSPSGTITVEHALPDTVLNGLAGSPLAAVLSHPLTDSHGLVIDSAELDERFGSTVFHLVDPLWMSIDALAAEADPDGSLRDADRRGRCRRLDTHIASGVPAARPPRSEAS